MYLTASPTHEKVCSAARVPFPGESRPFERIHMWRRGSDSCVDVAARVCQNVCAFESGKPACAHMHTSISAHTAQSQTLAPSPNSLPSSACLNNPKEKRRKMLRLPTRQFLNQTWMSLWNHFATRDDWESCTRSHSDTSDSCFFCLIKRRESLLLLKWSRFCAAHQRGSQGLFPSSLIQIL